MTTAKFAGTVALLAAFLLPLPSFGAVGQSSAINPFENLKKAETDANQAAETVNSLVQKARPQTKEKINDLSQPILFFGGHGYSSPVYPALKSLRDPDSAKESSKQSAKEPPKESPIESVEDSYHTGSVDVVSDTDRSHMCDEISAFAVHSESEEERYSNYALATIITATFLALVGSIASFLAKNKTAGVISLIVAAVVGFSNVYPLGPLGDFYRSLNGDAKALALECKDTRPYTASTYNSNLDQLKLLYVYEEKRPALGSYRLATDDLTKQLQVVRIASNNLTAAQSVISQGTVFFAQEPSKQPPTP